MWRAKIHDVLDRVIRVCRDELPTDQTAQAVRNQVNRGTSFFVGGGGEGNAGTRFRIVSRYRFHTYWHFEVVYKLL